MAYLFCDPFDNYTLMSSIWDLVAGTAPTLSATFRRFAPPTGITGQGCGFSSGAYARKNLPANSVTYIIGFAFYIPALPTGGNCHIVAILDNVTTQVSLGVSASGVLQFYRNEPSGGVAIGAATAPGIIAAGTWRFAEVQITIDASAGAVAVYLDGSATPAISSTGLNTKNSGNTFGNVLQIGDFSNGLASGIYYDDVRVFDNTGSADNAMIGDVRLITKMPSAAGDLSQWTPNGATPNVNCVNSIPPNTSKFVASATITQEDTYDTQSAGLLAAPLFMVARHYAQKDDGAVRTMQQVVRSSGSDFKAPAVTLASSWAYYDALVPVNDPHTGAPWTAAAADAAQVGQYEAS